jgi:thiosulfate/3-mercaptopyruvate sulfurtransferase
MISLLVSVLAAGVIGGLNHQIVTPAWLEENLGDPYVVVVEIGSVETANRPHIPGARFVSIESIVQQPGWPPNELPPVHQLAKAFENAGVGDEGRLILYSKVPIYATRAWFTLDYLGQGYRTAILDGGLDRWVLEKRPLTSKRVRALPKTFTPYVDESRLASLADVRDAAKNGVKLIDARPYTQYYGFNRGAQVARRGHIPGAECLPWQSNLAANGSYLSAEALRAKYEALIPDRNQPVIVYCRTGMDASMPYFVLRSLGYNVALHDGSYVEWSRDKTLPVARISTR